jgi:hypothetical protein
MAKEGYGGYRFRRFKLNALAATGGQTALGGHFYEQKEARGRARTVPAEATDKVSSGLPCICKSTANFDPVASGFREPPGGVCDTDQQEAWGQAGPLGPTNFAQEPRWDDQKAPGVQIMTAICSSRPLYAYGP